MVGFPSGYSGKRVACPVNSPDTPLGLRQARSPQAINGEAIDPANADTRHVNQHRFLSNVQSAASFT